MNSFPLFLVLGLVLGGAVCLWADRVMGRWAYCHTCGTRIKPSNSALVEEGTFYCSSDCLPADPFAEPAAYRKATGPASALGRPWYTRR